MHQCADIYTKAFTDKYKWFQNLVLINHYPNFAVKRQQYASRIYTRPDIHVTDDVPYKPRDLTERPPVLEPELETPDMTNYGQIINNT